MNHELIIYLNARVERIRLYIYKLGEPQYLWKDFQHFLAMINQFKKEQNKIMH